jgi:uncharacterized membrane protein YkoI
MRLQMTARHWLMGAGAATLLVAGGLAAGPVASLAQSNTDADLSQDEAAEIAVAEFPDATVLQIDPDDEDGMPVYEITLSNGYELEIDGNSGAILETEREDGDDEGHDDDDRDDDGDGRDDDTNESGTLDDGAAFLPEASISVEDAIAAAQGAAEGAVGEVDLENYRGELVFIVDIGWNDVVVDATSGEVLGVEVDD